MLLTIAIAGFVADPVHGAPLTSWAAGSSGSVGGAGAWETSRPRDNANNDSAFFGGLAAAHQIGELAIGTYALFVTRGSRNASGGGFVISQGWLERAGAGFSTASSVSLPFTMTVETLFRPDQATLALAGIGIAASGLAMHGRAPRG